MGSVGEGMRRVYVLRRADARGRQPLIVWFHGYGTMTVASQEPWLAHMAERATVLFPVYNEPPFDRTTGGERLFPAAASGLRRAIARLRARDLVSTRKPVVGGYSLGGALAADYARAATQYGLPRPAGLYVVFAGRGLCGKRTRVPRQDGAIAARTRIVAIASRNDLLAGTCEAREIVRSARQVPAASKKLRLVRAFELGDHFAPTRFGPRERATFWAPLDRLRAQVAKNRKPAAQATRREDRR
jgi:hypothetical protein